MIVYYSVGGGLGHLARAKKVISQLKLHSPVLLISASKQFDYIDFPDNVSYHKLADELTGNVEKLKKHLQQLILNIKPKKLIIDSFPNGIKGELNKLPQLKNMSVILIARSLQWQAYKKYSYLSTIKFDQVLTIEPLETDYLQYLSENSTTILKLSLRDCCPQPINTKHLKTLGITADMALWIVTHSGPLAEVTELLDYANDMMEVEKVSPQVLLISPFKPEHTVKYYHAAVFPACPYFDHADRIITGCGFNSMQETRKYREKHFFIPFYRRYDDQFARAARCRVVQ